MKKQNFLLLKKKWKSSKKQILLSNVSALIRNKFFSFFTYLNSKESKKNAIQLPPFLFLVDGDRHRNLLDNRNRNVHLLDVVYWHWNSHLFHMVDGNRNRDWHLLHYGYRYLLDVMMMNRVHVIRHVDTNVVRTEIERIRLGFHFSYF